MAKSIRDPDSLSDAEVKVVDSYLISQVNQWTPLVSMEEAGLRNLLAFIVCIRSQNHEHMRVP